MAVSLPCWCLGHIVYVCVHMWCVCVCVWWCGGVAVCGSVCVDVPAMVPSRTCASFLSSIFHISSIKFLELRACAYPLHYLHHTTHSQVCALGCIFAATPHAFDTGGPTRVTATTTSTATTSTEIAQTPELGWTARSENYVDVTKGSEDHEETRC